MNSDENPMGDRETLGENHVDKISALPDAVLTRILSLLPTKDSVATSALSTRWSHLYATVHVIDFQYYRIDSSLATTISNAIATVSKKLPRVSKYRVHLLGTPIDHSVIASWVHNAMVSNSVQKLDLCAVSINSPLTPHSLFASKALVSLSLDFNFVLSVPNSVYLPNLKKLYLRSIVFSDDESVTRLFTSCPVLESLTIVWWQMEGNRVYKFNISVPLLKCLVLFLPELWEYEVLINCPNLETLNCKGYATREDSGDVLESMKHCYIDFELHQNQLKYGKMMTLIKQVSKVQFLSLTGVAMEALLRSPFPLPHFENLTHLELHSYYSEGWPLLPSLLESSPRLETLVFPRGFYNRNENGVPFSPPEHAPACLSFHLKVIEINRFFGEEDEYRIVEYFLMNALVLEKMEISLWSSGDSEDENDPHFKDEVESEETEEEESKMEMEGEGEDEDESKEEVEVEAEGIDAGEAEVKGEPESDLEWHFEITRRLLTFQRFSDVCQIIIISPDGEEY